MLLNIHLCCLISVVVGFVAAQQFEYAFQNGELIIQLKRRNPGSPNCRDECKYTSSCYIGYNCTHYQHCYTRKDGCWCQPMMCSFGTLWNPESNICDTASAVDCGIDPCDRKHQAYLYSEGYWDASKGPYSYSSGCNCRSFYNCDKGRSVPTCCVDNYRYDGPNNRCVPDDACNMSCSACDNDRKKKDLSVVYEDQENPYNKLECYYRQIPGDDRMYYDTISKKPRPCSAATVYRPEICSCATDNLAKIDCKPLVHIDFNGIYVEDKVKKIRVEEENVDITPSGQAGISYGLFNGNSSLIKITRYQGSPVHKILVRLRFYSDPASGYRVQTLYSNCPLHRQNASFAIKLVKSNKQLEFHGQSYKSKLIVIRLPYKVDEWNNVELMFDGKYLNARVRAVNRDGTPFEHKGFKKLEGSIMSTANPHMIGNCNANDAFFGYLDMVKVYDCIPNDYSPSNASP